MKITLKFSILISVALCGSHAHALSYEPGIDFNAHFRSQETDWLYSNNSKQFSKTTRLGIAWSEKLTETLSGGLQGGHLELTQVNNPISAARITSGYYLGIGLGSIPINMDKFKLRLGLDYVYNQAKNQESGQDIEIVWQQTRLTLQTDFSLVPRLTLILGGSLNWIDGEERATGTLTQIRFFDEEKTEGYYAGLDLATDPTGSIGVIWEGGTQEGVNIYFRRRF